MASCGLNACRSCCMSGMQCCTTHCLLHAVCELCNQNDVNMFAFDANMGTLIQAGCCMQSGTSCKQGCIQQLSPESCISFPFSFFALTAAATYDVATGQRLFGLGPVTSFPSPEQRQSAWVLCCGSECTAECCSPSTQ
jgi:hypothetical protein